MQQFRTRIRRFVIAYLAATLAAEAAMLVIQFSAILWIERDLEALAYFGELVPVYAAYGLGYTLVLGLVGWGLLTVLRQRSSGAYILIGGLLGFFAGALGVSNGLTPSNIYLYSFSGAGIAAAWTFHRLYSRRLTSEIGAMAAS